MRWYELNPGRFEIERRLLARFHPGAKLIIKKRRMRVVLEVITDIDIYLVEGVFADDHPYSSMRVYVTEPRLRGSPPHMFGDGELCLHDGSVGPETTAKVYLDWAKQWLLAYERWREGERWPRAYQG